MPPRTRLFGPLAPPSPLERFQAGALAHDLPEVKAALRDLPIAQRFDAFESAIAQGWAPAVMAAYPVPEAWPANEHAAAGLSRAIMCGAFDLLAPLLARCTDPDAGEGEALRWAAEDCAQHVSLLLTRMDPWVALPKLLEDLDWGPMDVIGTHLGDLARMKRWLAEAPAKAPLPQTRAYVQAQEQAQARAQDLVERPPLATRQRTRHRS